MNTKIQFFARSAKLGSALKRFHSERADLILTLFEGEALSGVALEADQLTGGMISRRIEVDGFESKINRVRVIDSDLSVPGLDHVILVGLGKRSKLTIDGLRQAMSAAFEYARDTARSASIVFPLIDVDLRGLTIQDFAQCLAEHATLIDYEKSHRKTREVEDDPTPAHLSSLTVLTSRWAMGSANRGLNVGKLLGEATCRARDMVNEPADVMTPMRLAAIARGIAKDSNGLIKCKALRKAKIKELGMGGLLAVSKASINEPVFIELTYTPAGYVEGSLQVIGLVGKGVTFDTGGVSIKDADGMRDMKCDMAGAAAVLQTMSLLSQLKPNVKVVAVVAASENLLDRQAFLPGAIVTSMSGLTVEIDNTDAEGRLTLMDALHYVQTVSGATRIIDIATLTGDVETALGNLVSGIYGNNTTFTREFLRAAKNAGESMHELPLSEEYRSENRGRMADLTNSADGPGSVVAALFLSEFIQPGTVWVHADIGATAYRRTARGIDAEGATGVCVRTLARMLQEYR